MNQDKLDKALEPLAIYLLSGALVIALAAVGAILVTSYIRRRKQRAHEKVSRSRRSKDTAYDLFGGR